MLEFLMFKLILLAIGSIGGIALWFLRHYTGLSARIEKWEKKREQCDKKLEQAVYAGRGDLVNKLRNERLQISKELNRLYSRQRKSIFYRRY